MNVREAVEQSRPGYCQTMEDRSIWYTLFSAHIANAINKRYFDVDREYVGAEQLHIATQKTTLDYHAIKYEPIYIKDSTAARREWGDCYRNLAGKYKQDKQKVEGKDYIPFSQFTDEDWDKIAHANFAVLSEKMRRQTEALEKAKGLLRVTHRGQHCKVYANQGMRDALVLSIAGDRALLEYQMPKGTTALRIVPVEDYSAPIRNCSYNNVPLAFLNDMIDHGIEWDGNAQAGHGRQKRLTVLQAYAQRKA